MKYLKVTNWLQVKQTTNTNAEQSYLPQSITIKNENNIIDVKMK